MGFFDRLQNKIESLFKEKKEQELEYFTRDIFKDRKYKIGEYTYGYPAVMFENPEANLYIGKFCSISEGVTIFLGGNHNTQWNTTYPFGDMPDHFPEFNHIDGHPATKGDVQIGNDVWLGRNVTILSGITIADGAVIGAETVVTKNVGPYEIWAGNPGKLVKKRFSEERINILLELKWWDWDIVKIKAHIPQLCSEENLTK